jgi:hypothetical protein
VPRTYGEIIEIAPHPVTSNEDTGAWRCRGCGAEGKVTAAQRKNLVYPSDLASAHVDRMVAAVATKMAPAQFIECLRRGASDSQHVAATELLIEHGHWMGYGYLRNYVTGGWDTRDGRLWLRISYGEVVRALDELHDIESALKNYGHDADAAVTVVRELINKRGAVSDRDRKILGSSSEIAMLKLACSLVSHGRINLGDDTSNLDNTNRGKFATAVSHMLAHGGGVHFKAARTWNEYHAGTGLQQHTVAITASWERLNRRKLAAAGGDPLDTTAQVEFDRAIVAVGELLAPFFEGEL